MFSRIARLAKGVRGPNMQNIHTWYKDIIFNTHYVDFKFKKQIVIEVKSISVQL